MNRLILSLSCLLCFIISSAQIKAVVADSHTKEPLPYANIWIENEKAGASADAHGRFVLPQPKAVDVIVVSVVGYATLSLEASAIKDTIFLVAKPIQLENVTVSPRKAGKRKKVVNPFKTIEQNTEINGKGGEGPFILARYISYDAEYAATPYLDKIRFRMQNPYKDMFFNLRLYAVADDGSPGDFLYDENIMVTFKKKKDYAVADLSKLNIRIPEEGFFVAAEFIITEENIAASVYDKFDENGRPDPGSFRYHHYGPVFVHEELTEDTEGWMYQQGKWTQKSVHWKGKYNVLAAEITLSD